MSLTSFNRNSLPRHRENVDRSKAGTSLATRHSPNAGRVLGESKSAAKKEAAQKNGQAGGRPPGS